MELGTQPSRCAPTCQRGGKAATGRKRDCSASTKPPTFLCEVPHCCGIRHAGLERLPVSSNLNLQLSQAPFSGDGIFCTIPKTNTPPSLLLILCKSIPYTNRQPGRHTAATVLMSVCLRSSPQPPLIIDATTQRAVNIFRGTLCSTTPSSK